MGSPMGVHEVTVLIRVRPHFPQFHDLQSYVEPGMWHGKT